MNHFTYLGVDVSLQNLDCAQRTGTNWDFFQVTNSEETIRSWLGHLHPNICLILEPTGTYHNILLNLAHEFGVAYRLVNSRQSYHYTKFEGHTWRNDKQASRTLAIIGEKEELNPSNHPSMNSQQRKQLHSAIKSLNKQAQALNNQIHAMKQYYCISQVAINSLTQTLEVVELQIDKLEKELNGLDDEEARSLTKLMQTVVGIGPKSAQRLLLYLGDLTTFESHKQVLKFIGVAPGGHTSGSSVWARARISKRGPADLRATLYMAARSAIRYNFACKDLYLRLREKGKPHKLALIAVVAKLIKQVFAVVKSKTEFDNQLYLKYL